MTPVSYKPHHVQRRRYLLWLPLMLLGMFILVTQLIQWEPNYLLVALGAALCIPWVADTC